jgi:hypothetical protein
MFDNCKTHLYDDIQVGGIDTLVEDLKIKPFEADSPNKPPSFISTIPSLGLKSHRTPTCSSCEVGMTSESLLEATMPNSSERMTIRHLATPYGFEMLVLSSERRMGMGIMLQSRPRETMLPRTVKRGRLSATLLVS